MPTTPEEGQYPPRNQNQHQGEIPRFRTEPLPSRLTEMLRRSAVPLEQVEEKPQKPPSLKVPLPEKFSGSSPNMDKLEAWTDATTRYLRLNHIDVKNMTTLHDWIAMMLTGEAADWFRDAVSYGANPADWDIQRIIEGLKSHFITQDSLLTAAKSFGPVKQNGRRVQELYNELEKFARRMVERPSDYEFRRRFMDGLDNHISVAMIRLGTTVEKSTLAEILLEAQKQEAALDYEKQAATAAKPRTTKMPTTMKRTYRNYVQREEATAPAVTMGRDKTSTAATKGTVPPSSMRCFNCQELGHRARECTKKKLGTKIARAAITMAERGDQTSETDEESEDEEGRTTTSFPEYNVIFEEDDGPQMNAAVVASGRIADEITKPRKKWDDVELPALELSGRRYGPQPNRKDPSRELISLYINVGEQQAHALIDTGVNTDIVLADFARAMGLETYPLKDPVSLQMACVGSKARISYGMTIEIKCGKIEDTRYFDIANLDQYDIILGIPFL
ncbi:hypothetical protein BOTBODRAFT_179097 [Botryobasidium botryosum FD-172 SS1]|uniref:CCHC-type domain-containing protein n=1 Tax=Botryobasidium botryosum (strain FD-172 SS1) TaxID=930990 RepID=A0A067M1H8_BOTB1|nr:hypothetical protein BOTBODRAFT_179097 [Botryobasidium botryosum FD-172 SS1]